jgi:hypothetical protein
MSSHDTPSARISRSPAYFFANSKEREREKENMREKERERERE